ncbi:polysaccharide biosynthesis protein [Puniceicoccus vermicola]|uniref:Polysaccharide biosynthesis protein n=1 Tax=Puniceicoccus vermicola TaxID=388746 RepID=A0A7X1AWR1_9BACT|nr:nucleoside-diphosphate sugar epimerase/dehydratase [Puniceicoccus vermicola]MBC2601209.1 polysaccharide biosynthesis protein [Puniceicoccus vermicola]
MIRIVLLALVYSALFVAALLLAYEVRFDFLIPESYRDQRWWALLYVLPLKLLALFCFGQFRGLLSFFRVPDLNRTFAALFLCSLIFFAIRIFPAPGLVDIPRGIILADLLFSTVGLVGFRMVLRIYREKKGAGPREKHQRHRVVVIGAGSTGAALAADLLARPQLGLHPVVFLDDDPEKKGRQIHGVPIWGNPEQLEDAAERFSATRIVIAVPTLQARRIREILKTAGNVGLETVIVPSLHELSSGRIRVEEMRRVEVEDLLGRESVPIKVDLIRKIVEGQTVLVTGAGGSIGSELVRQLATLSPKKLLLIDAAENALFEIVEEMREGFPGVDLESWVLDYREWAITRRILETQPPSVIFHAAAYKHVPLMESQPREAVLNNFLGTYQLSKLAIEFGVERFVLISTDKAINPTSVMGCSKRMAEIALQSLQRESQNTKFLAVRFGNVLGSSGSVIPTFRRQIARGGPVTVTHPEVTRYFMTISEAVGLVLQAASLGEGGEIFLLEMGDPIKIIDLARQMIQLSGYEPETEIEIEITGLRPGEKLFEELNYDTETSDETNHPRIRRLQCLSARTERFEEWIAELEKDLLTLSREELKKKIAERVPEYQPFVE